MESVIAFFGGVLGFLSLFFGLRRLGRLIVSKRDVDRKRF
jgi:hypothetical protein